MEKEKQEEDMFKPWGASTGTLSRRIIGASASMRNKYETSMQKGTIYLETSKILFLGDSGVGKTSLQRYFREKGFSKKYNITRGNEKHHVETAAVTDSWEDVKDPENEQQYAASYAAVKKTDYSPSESQTAVRDASFDQHFKLTFGLLCVCVAFALFPFGLCSLKIIGCIFSTLFYPDNLPMGIRYAEGAALGIFYRYACIEILYADSNMQKRMDNPDLFLEFQLRVLCCGLVIGFVLGYGCRAGTLLVFSFVCLKSQGIILNFFSIISNMLYEWWLVTKHTSYVSLIPSLILILCHVLLFHGKIKQVCLQVIVLNIAAALIYQMINGKKYLSVFNDDQATVITLVWFGGAVGIYVCKNTSPNLMRKRFYIWLTVNSDDIIAITVCSYFLCGLISWCKKKFCHYLIIFLACSSSTMLEYTAVMVIGRPLAKVYDLPFYIRRALGFILGAGMVYLMNWKVAIPPGEFLLDQLLSVGIVVAFEIWGFWQVKQAKAMGIDLTKIRVAKSKYENGVSGIRIKFLLIDCGGQEEYHYFHHLFIPKNAVYIIVFNFVDAKRFKDGNELRTQSRQLRYWLNFVLAHICLPDDKIYKNHRPIFIVGTHRDSVDKDVRQAISQELTHFLKKECIDGYIARNKETYIFEVENSEQLKGDGEGKHLRKQVAETAKLKRRKTKIKWLKLLEIMPKLSPIMKEEDLKVFVEKEGIVENQEFDNFVDYFSDRGEIYCCGGATNFIILQCGHLWFVELFLKMIEREGERDGVLSEETMNTAISDAIKTLNESQSMTPEDLKKVCRKLLEDSDLIVKDSTSSYHLVPNQLKIASQEDRESLWKVSPDKEITFGWDFEKFVPNPILWRLFSLLLRVNGDERFMDTKYKQTVYSDFAVFKEPSNGI